MTAALLTSIATKLCLGGQGYPQLTGDDAVADEPSELGKSLIGEQIYMRWETYGWQLGKITDVITNETPRLFKKFNFRCVWADKTK